MQNEEVDPHRRYQPYQESRFDQGLDLFNQQFAETWDKDKDKNDQTRSSVNLQKPSSRFDNKRTERVERSAHDVITDKYNDQSRER